MIELKQFSTSGTELSIWEIYNKHGMDVSNEPWLFGPGICLFRHVYFNPNLLIHFQSSVLNLILKPFLETLYSPIFMYIYFRHKNGYLIDSFYNSKIWISFRNVYFWIKMLFHKYWFDIIHRFDCFYQCHDFV